MPKKVEAPKEDIQFGVNWAKFPHPQLAQGSPNCEVNRRRVCIQNNIGDTPIHEHRRELIKLWWPKEEWHEWSERRMKSLTYFNFTTWLGPASCVDADTVIYNPNGESKTIGELYLNGEAPVVMTMDGPEQAEVPFIKGYEEMYEIVLSSGACLTATPEHRILSPAGYVRVEHLRIGDTLSSWETRRDSSEIPESYASRPRSTSDICPSDREQDALGSRKTVADWMDRCSPYFRPCDELPLFGQDIDRSFSPSRDGALEHTRSMHVGGRAFVSEHIHAYESDRPSMRCISLLSERKGEGCNLYYVSRSFAHGENEILPRGLLHSRTLHHSTSSESDRDERNRRCFLDKYVRLRLDQSWGVMVQDSTVVSIRRTKKRVVYDITVPKAGHYFAEGMIHHNSAKSADAAKMALEYWLESPHDTSVIVCSTTMQSLRRRIWAEVVAHHGQLDQKRYGYMGELLDASCIIRWQPGDSRHGIFGVAVEDGPVEDAVNNLIGFHPRRYFLILDEMQGVREAIMSHRLLGNITSNPEAKFLGMGNPSHLMSLLCRHATPIGGWDKIEKFQGSWEIDNHGFKGKGVCLFFDGRTSPACLDPEFAKRNPWMINADKIQRSLDRAGGNENDPAHMEQAIGWPPEKGLESTILDSSILIQFKVQQKPVWTEGFTKCACLDPAFGGGDSMILRFGKRGFVRDDEGARWVIGFDEVMEVPIDSAAVRPIHFQISDFVKKHCEARAIPPNECAILAAGEGGGVVSIMTEQWGPVVAIEEGGRPSERTADEQGKTAKDKYDTRASELCFGLRDFALGNGLRGLDDKAAEQACARRTFEKNGKWCAEPKKGSKGQSGTDEAGRSTGRAAKGFKERLGYSPGEFDSAAGLIEHCRLKGAEPAFAMGSPKLAQEWNKEAKELSTDFSSSNYQESDDWQNYAVNY